MHLKRVNILSEHFPDIDRYPFHLPLFKKTGSLALSSPVTFFVGENGTGKSTLLEAIAHRCGIHIWERKTEQRVAPNPYEDLLYRFIQVKWTNGYVEGSFFSGDLFRDFSHFLEEWSIRDPGMLEYYGGQSLLTLSHGQSLMAYFRSRYRIKGLYCLDEPETALSPASQIELLNLLVEIGHKGHAQFIIVTHSPILMACPGAQIFSFDHVPVQPIAYEKTTHYRIYKEFMTDPSTYLPSDGQELRQCGGMAHLPENQAHRSA